MTHLLKLSLAVLLFNGATAFAAAQTYTVKKGDTLANIARTRYGEPVFGPKGTLKKILKLNPDLKANVPLEPGQKIMLESKVSELAEEKPMKTLPVKVAPAARVEEEPAIPPSEAAVMSPAARAAHEMDLKPKGPMPETATVPHEPMHEPVAEHEEPIRATHETHAAHEEHAESGEHHNYFSFIPSYSIITQHATDIATNESYTMHSSLAWSAELGWDHWWNDSFSTVLTYSAMQFTSKESSESTGLKVLDKVNLNKTELALLNRVVHWLRFGAGIAYGDHLFLEGFSGALSNPQVYKMAFLNPFVMGEFTAYETPGLEALVNLKIGQLPAQVGFGHDVNTGTEYVLQASVLKKFEKYSVLAGLSYGTENQTRTDATEKRDEWALKVGGLF